MNNNIKTIEMTEDEMKTFILNQLLSAFKLYESKIAQTEAELLSLLATLSPKLDKFSDINSKEYKDFIKTYRQSARLSNEVTAARVVLKDLSENLKEVSSKLHVTDHYHINISSKTVSKEHLVISIAKSLDADEKDCKKFISDSIRALQGIWDSLDNSDNSPSFH